VTLPNSTDAVGDRGGDAVRSSEIGRLDASERAELELLRQVISTGPTGFVSIDADGVILAWNDSAAGMLGWAADEIVGRPLTETLIPAELRETHTAGMSRFLTTGEAKVIGRPISLPALHRDGHRVELEFTIWPSWVGPERRFYAFMRDMSEQRAADARLHQQAALLELMPAAVIVRRLDGTVLWWNTGAQRLYGWSAEAARGRRTYRLLNTIFENGSAETQRAVLESDGHWDGQVQHLTAHGRVVTVLSRQVVYRPLHVLRGEDGEDGEGGEDGGTEVLEINTDVTAARAAEQALTLSEQRFRAQFTHSAVGQLIRALDGSLIAVNKAFAAMLGRRPEDLIGRVVDAELVHPDDLAYGQHQIAGLYAGEASSYSHEIRLRHTAGHWVDAEATVSLVRDAQGRPKHLIVVATDISQRRIAERARDQAATALAERNTALEVANHLKLDIIGMLGHEISNPLSAILGYTDLLADEFGEDHAAAGSIAVISRQAQRLDEIVREVLSMVSIDAGDLSAVRGEVRLRDGISEALESTGDRGVPVFGPDVTVCFNPGHLQQILVNLLSNATKYAGGATAIRIAKTGGGRVLLRVEDRGPGVPEEFRPRLFDRLTRAERDSGHVRGTGLGLYIVRALAQANHGGVRHEPNPDGGSVFVLEAEVA
jgi:PAS domain S-box-containing protein